MVDKNITVLNYKTIALATEYLMNVTAQYHFQATRMAPSHVLRLVLKKVKFATELSYRSWNIMMLPLSFSIQNVFSLFVTTTILYCNFSSFSSMDDSYFYRKWWFSLICSPVNFLVDHTFTYHPVLTLPAVFSLTIPLLNKSIKYILLGNLRNPLRNWDCYSRNLNSLRGG